MFHFVVQASDQAAGFQVAAYPAFYDANLKGCEIPGQLHGSHQAGAIQPSPAITFALKSLNGTVVTHWAGGQKYDITFTAYTEAVEAWLHANIGAVPL
jgi:hypothetical protein